MFITIKWRVLTVLFNISLSLMFFYVTVLWFLESWVLKSSTIYMPCQCLYLLSVLSVFASCILNSQFLVACTFRIIIFAWVYLTFFFFFMKFGMLLAIICSIFFYFPSCLLGTVLQATVVLFLDLRPFHFLCMDSFYCYGFFLFSN